MTLSGWTKSINIKLYSRVELFNYQVNFIVHRSNGTNFADNIFIGTDCLENFNDIRFTSTTDEVYSYWIESSDSSSATIWVKIPSIAANTYTDIVLQYGNSEASAVSNGDATFEFFDDFDSETLNTTTKWTVNSNQPYSISNSILTLTGINDAADYISSKLTFSIGYAIRMRSRCPTSHNSIIGFYDGGYNELNLHHARGCASRNGNQITGSTGDGSSFHIYEFQRISDKLSIINQDTTNLLITTNIDTISINSLRIWLRQYMSDSNQMHDWILIRKMSPDIEPTKYYPQILLTNWNYRRGHTLTSDTPLTDYQVKIRIYRTEGTSTGDTVYLGNKCLASYDDIRFVASNGVDELPYWMEANNGTYADFWVKVPSISINTFIWIYYGNENVSTTSNGDATFEFFDDFTGITLNTSKWNPTFIQYNYGLGTATINKSLLTLTQTLNDSTAGISLSTTLPLSSNINKIRLKCNSRTTSNTSTAQTRIVLTTHDTLNPGTFGIYTNANESKTYLHNGYNIGNPYIDDPWILSSPSIYEFDNYVTDPKLYKDSTIVMGTGTPSSLPSGNYIRIWCYSTSTSISLDWILVRKYAPIEPLHISWPTEQKLGTPSLYIIITPTSGTDPLSVTYNLSISDPLDNFVLNYGDGNTYTANDVTAFATTHTYDTPGTYTVWAEGYNEFATHVFYQIPDAINVNSSPVNASFTIEQTANHITFTDTSSGNVNEWYWDFGDNTFSHKQNPSHLYYSIGTYTITLYASNQYQYDTYTTTVTVTQILTPPEVYFTPNNLNVISPALPYTVNFTNLSTPTFGCTYNWLIDGTTYTTENPSHSFATYGMYDVRLTVTNALGSATKTYNDAIRITRKGKTFYEVINYADTPATFHVEVFNEVATSADTIIQAHILDESINFVQDEVPDEPGLDEWGMRHFYSSINEWGHRIISAVTDWGNRILYNGSTLDNSPVTLFKAQEFREDLVVEDSWQFGTT